jgi:Tfp pilus assembly protein PilN
MIRVNLIGSGRNKGAGRTKAKAGVKLALPSMPATFTPILLIVIIVGFAASGFLWYSRLSQQLTDLDTKIRQAQAQKAALDKVIQTDQIYEARKKALENRVKIISDLQRNQLSPVLALDQLSEAVDRTKYVWLSNLDQNNAILSMSGTGTSLNAIADFYTNLISTGYFKNIDVSNAQDTNGNYTFQLRCEFAPPRPPSPPAQTAAAGGN